jgi:integrase
VEGIDPPQGWPQAIKTFRLKKDAENWATNTEDEMIRGVYIKRAAPHRFTVADAVVRYLKEVTPKKADSTQGPEKRRAETVKSALGKYAMAAVTPDIVRSFMDRRHSGADRKDRKGNLILKDGKPIPRANDTVRLELAFLGDLFQVAIDEWKTGLPYNPVKSVRRPKGVERVRRLSPDEEKALFKALDEYSNPMLGWIVRIAIETAMRESEIIKLRKHQFDPKKRTITIPHTKNGKARTVPLNKAATELFVRSIDNPVRPASTDLIFPGEPGRDGKIRPYQFLSCWRTLKIRAGISDYRFHDNRHEWTSRLVEMGLSDQAVAGITGHTDMQSLARYSHLRSQKLVKMLDDSDSVSKTLDGRKRKNEGLHRDSYARRRRARRPRSRINGKV